MDPVSGTTRPIFTSAPEPGLELELAASEADDEQAAARARTAAMPTAPADLRTCADFTVRLSRILDGREPEKHTIRIAVI
jgi:hypothetical protein